MHGGDPVKIQAGRLKREALLLASIVAVGLAINETRGESASLPNRKEAKAIAAGWSEQIIGKHYYLTSRRDTFLINDEVTVVECAIRYSQSTDPDTGVVTPGYRAKLRFEGVFPAPGIQLRLIFEDFPNIDSLLASLDREFSRSPLEDAYDWPPEVKLRVRYRYVALGMDKEMVGLALGGLDRQVDLEKLDDGRIRETWKLQVARDTRTIFTERTAFLSAHSTELGQAFGTFGTLTQTFSGFEMTSGHVEVQGTTDRHTTAVAGESGFLVFSGLPPQFLSIIFTDGHVTARKTEFVK